MRTCKVIARRIVLCLLIGSAAVRAECPIGQSCIVFARAAQCLDNGDPTNYTCDGKLRSPEEKAQRLRDQQEIDRKNAAELARQSAERAAALAAAEVKRKQVAEQTAKLGNHRAVEAKRLVEMRDAASRAKKRAVCNDGTTTSSCGRSE